MPAAASAKQAWEGTHDGETGTRSRGGTTGPRRSRRGADNRARPAGAARALPRDAHDPAHRGGARPLPPARTDPRRVPHLRRAGGDRRRRLRPPRAHRRGVQHPSRPRPRAGEGSRPGIAHRRALRAGHRLLAGARRQHAPLRARDRPPGHERHRRPLHPPGGRRRLRLQARGEWRRGGRVLR